MHATSTCVSQRKQRKRYSHTITNNRAQSMEKDRHNNFAWRYEFVQILNEPIYLLFVILHTDPEWIDIFVVSFCIRILNESIYFLFIILHSNHYNSKWLDQNMLHRRNMVSMIWRRNQDGLDLEPMIPYTKTMSSTFGYRGVPESCSERSIAFMMCITKKTNRHKIDTSLGHSQWGFHKSFMHIK